MNCTIELTLSNGDVLTIQDVSAMYYDEGMKKLVINYKTDNTNTHFYLKPVDLFWLEVVSASND